VTLGTTLSKTLATLATYREDVLAV
jgi:hypothetical protein